MTLFLGLPTNTINYTYSLYERHKKCPPIFEGHNLVLFFVLSSNRRSKFIPVHNIAPLQTPYLEYYVT